MGLYGILQSAAGLAQLSINKWDRAGERMCVYIDLPPTFESLYGGSDVRIQLRHSNGGKGAEVVYSFVMPRSVFMASLEGAQDTMEAIAKAEAQSVILQLPKRMGG